MPWSIHDAVQLEHLGVPTVTVCTDKFFGFGQEKAAALKAGGLALVAIPHPITGRRSEEVIGLAKAAVAHVAHALITQPLRRDR